MALVIKPPAPLLTAPSTRSVFLAGSIEMGAAAPWQAEVEEALAVSPVTLWNPRRVGVPMPSPGDAAVVHLLLTHSEGHAKPISELANQARLASPSGRSVK